MEQTRHGSGTLAPTLLFAMPQLTDPNFSRSVVLLCRAGDDGAMGLVVNHPTQTRIADIVDFDPPLVADNRARTWIGGPVEPYRGWILLGAEGSLADAFEVAPGLHLSGALTVLRRIVEEDAPGPSRFLLGYAGWGQGQLEAELAASAWLTTPPSASLIFDTPPESMWEEGIRSLGIDPFALQTGGGVH